jgi:hypothetical protein
VNFTRAQSRSPFTVLLPLALAGCAFYAIAFYPGALNFDSAYQWWQARGNETSNIHGIGMTMLWRLSEWLAHGPGPIFLLQVGLLWCGLLLIAASLPVADAWRVLFLLGAATSPVVFVLFSAVVSDAVLMGVLCCALGTTLWTGRCKGHALFLLTIGLLLVAVLVRKNAIFAVVPLAILAADREFLAAGRRRVLLVGLSVAGLLYASSLLLERTVDRRLTVFAATALWDLAAISIAVNELLLPPATHPAETRLVDLERDFVSYANTTIFAGPSGLIEPFLDAEDPLNGEILRSWITAVLAHPQAYLAHRWQVTRGLFGSKQADWPRELVYFSGTTQYRDNPALPARTGEIHEWTLAQFEARRSSAVFAAWPYLLLAVIAIFVAWHRRESALAKAALATAASGLLYAAPLPFIAPSIELRYVGWTCLAGIISVAMAICAVRSQSSATKNDRLG